MNVYLSQGAIGQLADAHTYRVAELKPHPK